jgi:uncharacterized SAM-binding protein YcdF (DUF218 family)
METLIALAIVWVLWLSLSRRWKKRLKIPFTGAIMGLIILSPLGLTLGTWGLTATLPTDSNEIVDAIVVLGRGEELRNQRIAAVRELWQSKRAPQIFASGRTDAHTITQALEELGIPASQLRGEECSQSTEENALFTSAILKPIGIKTILLVTDAPHMWRSLLLFQNTGLQVVPHPISLSAKLNIKSKILILGREYLALAKYALFKQAQSRFEVPAEGTEKEVIYKIQNWKCQF